MTSTQVKDGDRVLRFYKTREAVPGARAAAFLKKILAKHEDVILFVHVRTKDIAVTFPEKSKKEIIDVWTHGPSHRPGLYFSDSSSVYFDNDAPVKITVWRSRYSEVKDSRMISFEILPPVTRES